LDGNISGAGLTSGNIGVSSDLVIQFTGLGTASDSYFRLKEVNDKKQITIHKTGADVDPIPDQYAFTVSSSSKVDTESFSGGLKTITTFEPHGLVAGNRFQLNNSSNINQGSYIVKTKVGVTTFTFELASDISVDNGFILKHGLSANDGVSDSGQENLSIRGVELFDNEHAKLSAQMGSGVGIATVDTTNTHNLLQRFPYGSYLLIDEEILRVSTNTLLGVNNDQVSVIRGVFGTVIKTHATGSLVKKIKPFPIQFNRPSILRASGHTFEYLGYGPGNYSTALPQVQVKTISEKEEFLSQSQERAGGAVVYTGMNNKGDFYIGNQKKSALTGEETSFDTPIPSVTGENPGRLSVVFDETTIKERLVVEGGKSKTSLSEFDGPVTFNKEVQLKDAVKIKTTTDSTSSTTGSLIISGGVGIAKTANLPDDAAIKFGNGGDLEIFHGSGGNYSNTNVIRTTNTNTLLIEVANGSAGLAVNHRTGNDISNFDNMITANPNDSVDLFFNGTRRLKTTNTGVVVTGILTATQFKGDGSQLDGLNNAQLLDSGSTVRAAATTSGLIISGITTVNGNIQLGSGNPEIELNGGGPRFRVPSANVLTIHTGGGFGSDENERLRVNTTGITVTGSGTFTDDVIAFSSSDITLKKDISPIKNALDMVNSISGNTFTWNTGLTPYENGTKDTGILAQEIEALGLPGVTITRDNGVKAVRYDRLIPVLIEAVKELTSKVNSLENK